MNASTLTAILLLIVCVARVPLVAGWSQARWADDACTGSPLVHVDGVPMIQSCLMYASGWKQSFCADNEFQTISFSDGSCRTRLSVLTYPAGVGLNTDDTRHTSCHMLLTMGVCVCVCVCVCLLFVFFLFWFPQTCIKQGNESFFIDCNASARLRSPSILVLLLSFFVLLMQ
jgi:hypothetical protein